MTTPQPEAAQMPPLPVVAYRLPDLDIKSKHHYFDFNEVLNSSHLLEPLCKVSDAQAYAAQRCQELEARLAALTGLVIQYKNRTFGVAMNPVEQLKSVLCDSSGKCCIHGTDADRAIVNSALAALASSTPVQPVVVAADADPDEMNDLHGEGYGVDWEYPASTQPTTALSFACVMTAQKLVNNQLARLKEENFGRLPRDKWTDQVLHLRDALDHAALASSTPIQPTTSNNCKDCDGSGQCYEPTSDTQPADKRHVGDSHFEEWYESYPQRASQKQACRDAYAAGMGDTSPRPSAVEQEPVAQYQVRDVTNQQWCNVGQAIYDEVLKNEGANMVRKLYTRSATSDAAGWQRQPLTDRQIDDLAANEAHIMPKPGVFQLTVPMLRKIIEAAIKAQPVPDGNVITCAWTKQDDDEMPGTYASACGEMWSFVDGGLAENNVRFCHGCGKPVTANKAKKD